jgi:histidinol phosphatase-like enzyme (inositol monophosphatase family)
MSSHLFSAFRSELVFALDVSEQAGRIALGYFKSGVEVTLKYDGTPVTIADQEVERFIRGAIQNKFPEDAMLGEEKGLSEGKSSTRRWLIDPIDGTYGFARGSHIWSVLVALEEDQDVTLGVVHVPATQETYWAQKGKGAWKNGKQLRVSSYANMSEAQFNFGAINRIQSKGYWPGFERIIKTTGRQRGYGDYLGFTSVLEGRAEANLEVGLYPWDLAPFKILVLEAGGAYSDLAGGQSVHTGNCLISNGILHAEFLKLLAP